MYVTHIDNGLVSGSFNNDTTIGTIHYQCFGVNHTYWSYKNNVANYSCYKNYSTATTTAGMDVAYGSPVAVLGSANTGTRQECSSIPDTNPAPVVTPRVGLVTNNDTWIKENGLDTSFTTGVYYPTKKVVVSCDRIGVLDTNGTLNVKQGGVSSAFTPQPIGQNVVDFAMTQNRIVMLKTDNTLYGKFGDLYAQVLPLRVNVKAFDLTENRVGEVDTDGTARIKEGDINAAWSPNPLDYGITQIHLAGNRIGVLIPGQNGLLRVKEPGVNDMWHDEDHGVTSFALTPNRVGTVTPGLSHVKDGGLDTGWSGNLDSGNISQIKLAGGRIGLLPVNGSIEIKEPGANDGWHYLAGNVTDFDMTTNTED